MKRKYFTYTFLVSSLLIACIMEPKKEAEVKVDSPTLKWEEVKLSKTDSILNLALTAHGGNKYNTAAYSFNFRGKQYNFVNNGDNFEYQKKVKTDTTDYVDYIKNGVFSRLKGGREVSLSEKDKSNAKEGLNSVIYFATLPHKLTDKAVNKSYAGTDSIKGSGYHILEVTFDQEGGGKDHDDEFYYWINSESHKIDYLAYNYKVNNGGVRFRSAYNVRTVDGITFQNYINFKAEVGTRLADLPKLYELDSLVELSRIETENVINLSKQ